MVQLRLRKPLGELNLNVVAQLTQTTPTTPPCKHDHDLDSHREGQTPQTTPTTPPCKHDHDVHIFSGSLSPLPDVGPDKSEPPFTDPSELLDGNDSGSDSEDPDDDSTTSSCSRGIPSDLSPYLDTHAPFLQSNADRFIVKVSALVTELKTWADEQTLEDHLGLNFRFAEMALSTIRTLQIVPVTELIRLVLDAVPFEVKATLGRKSLSLTNLLELPSAPMDRLHWGVYADIAVTNDMPSGLYIGSSANKKGLRHRIKEHLNVSKRPFDSLPDKYSTSRHYQHICQADTSCNIRMLAFHCPDSTQVWQVRFIEGIMMAYLGSVPSSPTPKPSLQLLDRMRKQCLRVFHNQPKLHYDLDGMVNFESVGLNRVWAFAQGWQYKGKSEERAIHEEWAKTHEDVCCGCGALRPAHPGDAKWVGFTDKALCRPCYDYLRRNGTDRPKHVIERLEAMHLLQTGEAEETCCARCGAPMPKNARSEHGWQGFGKNLRCHRCYQYRATHNGKERPKKFWSRRKYSFKQHQEWVAQGNLDICYNCKIVRPLDWLRLAWKGFLEESRCRSCYQWRFRKGVERPMD